MASGGPIERQDIITDDALKAPGIMTEELQKMIDKLDDVVKKSQEYAGAFNSNDSSTAKLRDSTAGLADEQKVLTQVQTQINTLIAKQSDAYIEQVGVLNNLKQAVKDKTALGDQEAQSITRENASRNQLLAALNSNRAAYSNLRSEQERNSPTGQALLKTIQDQFKAYSDLSSTMGVNTQKVGAYRSELEELVEKFGSVNPEIREASEGFNLFKTVGSAVLSPLGLLIGSIATAIGITKSALDVFYEDSIQGQDALNGRFNTWKALLEIVKDSLFNFGSIADSWLGKLVDGFTAFITYTFAGAEGLANLAEKTEKLNAVTELQNDIKKEEIKLTVEGSALELEKQQELYTAREKANRQLEDRYDALQKAKALQKEEVDLQLTGINNEIALQQRVIQVNATKNVIGLTANQILAEANELGRVNYEQIEKLAQLEVKRNQILGEQFQGQRRVQALEATLIQEQTTIIIDQYKAKLAALDAANVEELKADQAQNNAVLQNQRASLVLKLQALSQNYSDQQQIDDFAKFQEIRTEREKFEAKAQISKEGYDKIRQEANGDLKQFAILEREAKSEIVDQDEAFNIVRDQITKKYETKRLADKKKVDRDYLNLELDFHKQLLVIEQQLATTFVASTQKIGDDQFQALQESLNARQNALQTAYNEEIKAAGDNANEKIAIEAKYAEDQKKISDASYELKVKQAKFDKIATLLQLGLKEAFAIAELLPYFNNPLTAAWASIQLTKTVALATLEEAAVAAKPLPQYESGTLNHPGGPAVVHPGELVDTGQQLMLTPSRPTVLNLPEHSKVFTMQETTRMLALQGLGVPERLDRVQKLDDRIVRELRQTNNLLSRRSSSLIADGVALIQVEKTQAAMVNRIRSNVMIGKP